MTKLSNQWQNEKGKQEPTKGSSLRNTDNCQNKFKAQAKDEQGVMGEASTPKWEDGGCGMWQDLLGSLLSGSEHFDTLVSIEG